VEVFHEQVIKTIRRDTACGSSHRNDRDAMAGANQSLNGQAVAQDAGISKLSAAEKGVTSKISGQADYSANLEQANQILAAVDKDMRKSMDTATDNLGMITLTVDTVYLGTDRTFTTADYWNTGTSSWGLAPMFYGASTDPGARKDRAATVVGPGGYGGAGAWSQIGKTWLVSGTGSRSANIRMSGYMYGLTSAFAGGTGNTVINLVVKDLSTGTTYSTNIYSQGASGAGWCVVNQNFNSGVNVNLQAGHAYAAYLELQTSAAVYGAGEGGSDFGPQDGDDDGEGTYYNNIIVDF